MRAAAVAAAEMLSITGRGSVALRAFGAADIAVAGSADMAKVSTIATLQCAWRQWLYRHAHVAKVNVGWQLAPLKS